MPIMLYHYRIAPLHGVKRDVTHNNILIRMFALLIAQLQPERRIQ